MTPTATPSRTGRTRGFYDGHAAEVATTAMAVYAVALTVSILADASGIVVLSDGARAPAGLHEFERSDRQTSTTFGPDLGVLCLPLGTLIGAAAIMVSRRGGAPEPS